MVLVVCDGGSQEGDPGCALGRRIVGALRRRGFQAEQTDDGIGLVERIQRHRPEFVFVALVGRSGEEGTLQSLLQSIGVPYTGPDLNSCLRCWDKHACKQLLRAHGLSTPPWRLIHRTFSRAVAAVLTDEIGYPLFVKPARGALSLGAAVVQCSSDLHRAVLEAFDHDDRVIVERFVGGRELTVTVVGPPTDPRPLPIVEIVTDEPRTSMREEVAATLSVADLGVTDRSTVEAATRRAYASTGCRDLAQVEIVLDVAGRPHVIELTTSPDLGQKGPAMLAVNAAGMTFDDLVEAVIRRAVLSPGAHSGASGRPAPSPSTRSCPGR